MPKGRCKKYKRLEEGSGSELDDLCHYLSYGPKIVMCRMLAFISLLRHSDSVVFRRSPNPLYFAATARTCG